MLNFQFFADHVRSNASVVASFTGASTGSNQRRWSGVAEFEILLPLQVRPGQFAIRRPIENSQGDRLAHGKAIPGIVSSRRPFVQAHWNPKGRITARETGRQGRRDHVEAAMRTDSRLARPLMPDSGARIAGTI